MYHRQISRGDLLRWLKSSNNTPEAAIILGYQAPEAKNQIQKNKMPVNFEGLKSPSSLKKNLKETPKNLIQDPKITSQLKRPAEYFYTFQERIKTEQFAEFEPENTLTLDDERILNPQTIQYQSIINKRQLQPFLQKSLSYHLGKKLDIKKLIKQITCLKFQQNLPYKSRQIPAGRIYILLDLNKRMLPFWDDAHELCEFIKRKQGKQGLEIRMIDDNPNGCYQDWFNPKDSQAYKAFCVPSVVFIISDMGQLQSLDIKENGEIKPENKQINIIQQRWLQFLQKLHKQGLKPIVLSPLVRCQQNPEFLKWIQQHLWQKQGILSNTKPCQVSAIQQQSLEQVLSFIAIAVHVEPQLLRQMLACLPMNFTETGIEASLYLHPDIHWGYTAICLKNEKKDYYQALFKQQPPSLQIQILKLIQQHHSQLVPAVWAEEIITAHAITGISDPSLGLKQAQDLMQRLTNTFQSTATNACMQQYVRRQLQRSSKQSRKENNYMSTLYGLTYSKQIRQGKSIPAGYNNTQVLAQVAKKSQPQDYYLYQQGEQLIISKQSQLQHQDFVMGKKLLQFTTSYDSIQLKTASVTTNIVLESLPRRLCQLDGTNIKLYTGREQLQLVGFHKPDWAHAILQNNQQLQATIKMAGKNFTFSAKKKQNKWFVDKDNKWFGFDRYGIYADIPIKGIIQRFRYIRPTTFYMGSPEIEIGRNNNEILHQVRLVKGYWLADSTVTQALWKAVMGNNNPSRFKGENHPVENISWSDCQNFLEILKSENALLDFRLPTEAEWENACRAGKITPFSFGENISPQQVNYNNRTEDWLDRDKTVEVRSLPANIWGLHEMHGNVREWCQDWFGEYSKKQTLTDSRVLRGGSWIDDGKSCRCAYRNKYFPDLAFSFIGFRLSLEHLNSVR